MGRLAMIKQHYKSTKFIKEVKSKAAFIYFLESLRYNYPNSMDYINETAILVNLFGMFLVHKLNFKKLFMI